MVKDLPYVLSVLAVWFSACKPIIYVFENVQFVWLTICRSWKQQCSVLQTLRQDRQLAVTVRCLPNSLACHCHRIPPVSENSGCVFSVGLQIRQHSGMYLHYKVVPGVSHVKKCDWLVKNMTDWQLEVDLGQLNDWRRLAVNTTGGGDFA